MEEYRENGARLGWMIDPERRRVTIYRAAGSVESRDRSISLSGEDVLRGFAYPIHHLGVRILSPAHGFVV